jgi:hypothetical protein
MFYGSNIIVNKLIKLEHKVDDKNFSYAPLG